MHAQHWYWAGGVRMSAGAHALQVHDKGACMQSALGTPSPAHPTQTHLPSGAFPQAGKAVDIPIYDFTTHQRCKETRRVEPADVIIVEGGFGGAWVG